ncbi:MAG TPA: NERD domain-containing protein [Corynebacterium pollutisoli]|nr:NERD domain-containing protein [Corynebacterium pollutisoli]
MDENALSQVGLSPETGWETVSERCWEILGAESPHNQDGSTNLRYVAARQLLADIDNVSRGAGPTPHSSPSPVVGERADTGTPGKPLKYLPPLSATGENPSVGDLAPSLIPYGLVMLFNAVGATQFFLANPQLHEFGNWIYLWFVVPTLAGPLAWKSVKRPGSKPELISGSFALHMLFWLGTILHQQVFWMFAAWVALGVGVVARRKFLRSFPRRSSFVDADEAQREVFGGGSDLESTFGASGARGRAGEEVTMGQVERYIRSALPEVKMYNGLRFTPTSDADMDHVVLYGNRVALIDTKNFRSPKIMVTESSDYPGEMVITTPSSSQGFRLRNRASIASYAQHLDTAVVQGFVLFQNQSGPVDVVDMTDGDLIIGNAQEVLPTVVRFLTDQAGVPPVDRYLMKDLHLFFPSDTI